MERKLCAGCGEPSLANEPRCWACGGFRFVADNARIAGDQTIYIEDTLDVTHQWDREPRSWMPMLYVGGAAGLALFMCIVGFWLGRASTPAPAQAASAPVTHSPIALPTPPTVLAAPGGLGRPAADPTIIYATTPDPPVRVRQVGARPPAVTAPAPSAAASASPFAPTTVVQPAVPAPPRRPVTIYRTAPQQATLPHVSPAAPRNAGSRAIVQLRNDTGSTVEVAFEGPGGQTVRVPAGGALPVPMTAGSYQIGVSSGAAVPGRASAVLVEGKTYGLTVDGRKEEGATRLMIIEPSIDGD